MFDNWPVKDQGQRRTCVAFALTACRELRDCRSRRMDGEPDASPKDLSEQYLYWAAKQIDRWPTKDGTTVCHGAEALRDQGVCEEALWEYTMSSPAGGHPITHAPPGIPGPPHHENAQGYRSACVGTPRVTSADVCSALVKGHAVALALEVLMLQDAKGNPVLTPHESGVLVPATNWMNAHTRTTGRLVDPDIERHLRFVRPAKKAGHAVCVFGYREDSSAPGMGWFLFRNSYGARWTPGFALPNEPPFNPGYGYVSTKFVDDYTVEIGAFSDGSSGTQARFAD